MDPADQPAAADDAGTATTSEDKTASSRSPNTNSPTTGRSYECTFCKRGFSNAQALGGHMNIHRKDRAKLKQPPTLQAAAQHFPFSLGTSPRISEYPSSYTVMPRANPSSSPRQLQPLFVDGPASRREDTGPREKEQGPELDLELRLGPDAAAMG